MSFKRPEVNERVKPSYWPLATLMVAVLVLTLGTTAYELFVDDSLLNRTDTVYHASQSPSDSPEVAALVDKYGSSDGLVHVYAYFPKDGKEIRCFHINGDPRQGSECYPVEVIMEMK